VDFRELGGIIQDIEFNLEYVRGDWLAGVVVNIPLQKNAFNQDPLEKAYGDEFGIFINPYLQWNFLPEMGVMLGAYMHNIGNNPSVNMGEDSLYNPHNRFALLPFLRFEYRF
jgi:hypothetical protein